MRIVIHGANASTFLSGFMERLGERHDIVAVPDMPSTPAEVDAFQSAEVLIGIKLDKELPRPGRLRLYHAPAAGVDAIDRSCLPPGATLCNAPGHEQAIAEFVFAGLLQRYHPLQQADRELRQAKWATYWAGLPTTVRKEMGDDTLGVLGYGNIGKAVAARGKAFGMRICIANRTPPPLSLAVDESYGLDRLGEFMGSADAIVVTLPLTPDTQSLVGGAALAAMKSDALIVNVGRGAVIDEAALFEALAGRRIGGAIIDTWYAYPSQEKPEVHPSRYPFHELDNVVMTPHMSGWTHGTIRRRQQVMIANIERLEAGQSLKNVV